MTSSAGELDGRWRQAIAYAIVPASILYGILSGFRLPSRWATTNLIFDYHFGFTKRGLFGELLAFLKTPPYTYPFLAAIAYGIFLVSLGLLVYYFRKGRAVSIRALLLFAGFFTSVGFVFLVHEVGYLDHIGLLLALICVLLGPGYAGVCVRLALCALGILVHEAFMLLFLPAVLADLWLVARPLGARESMLRVLIVAVPCILLALHMGRYKAEVAQSVQIAYYNAKLSDSTIREDAIDPLHLSLSDNLQVMADFYQSPKYLRIFVSTVVVAAPLVIFYLWIVSSILTEAGVAFLPRLILVAVGVSPLALNIFAWDEVRFISLTQVTSFLLVLSVTRRMGWRAIDASRFRELGVLAVALIALNLGSEVTLFDGYVMQKFPFTQDLRSFVKAAGGSAPLVRAPIN